MAYGDTPKVDDNSIRSEESVFAVKKVLSRRNGFISREESPDYGVDLDVELVNREKGATSQKFAVQIKSAKKIAYVQKEGTEYVVLPFKTSRLSYLCNRTPAYGIIALHEENSEAAYFDYVDAIVPRLDEHNADWREQETVTIYIAKQLLTDETALALHERMTTRFLNHQLLLVSSGATYGIPVFDTNQPVGLEMGGVDFNNPQHVEGLLEKYGFALLNQDSLDILLHCLGQLTVRTISNSSNLLLLSALGYGRAGYIIETESYLRRCFLLVNEFDAIETELLYFTKWKTAYLKGEITSKDFAVELASLAGKTKSKVNAINFQSNIIYMRLLELVGKNIVDASVKREIDDLFKAIEDSGLDEEDQSLLQLFNADNLHIYADQVMVKEGNRVNLQFKLGAPPPLQERIRTVRALIPLIEESSKRAFAIYKKYQGTDNKRVQGYALLSIARMFQNTQFSHMLLQIDEERSLVEGQDRAFAENEKAALNAYDFLVDCNLMKEAHQALSIAYDIKTIYKLCFGMESGLVSTDAIITRLQHIESEVGLKPFKSVVEEAYYELKHILHRGEKSMPALAEEDVLMFARRIIEAYNLPEDRLPNLLLDMRNHQLFEQYSVGSDFELLNDQNAMSLGDMSFSYMNPPSYRLRHKKLGFESLSSRNLPYLLQAFGLMPKA